MTEQEKGNPDVCEEREKSYELLCGIVLTIFAAMLAIANLAAGRFEGDQMVAVNEKASAYSWYTSKSIKQTLVEGQHAIVESLLAAGAVNPDQEDALIDLTVDLDVKAEKYQAEKTEILLGSDAVGEENWIQDVDGEMGAVVGASEWEDLANTLDEVGDYFDLSILFLELSIVLGAISLILSHQTFRRIFFSGMTILGLIGTVVASIGIYFGLQV